MDQKKSKYIKLGLFIVAGLALFVAALFYIGSKDNIFSTTFDIYSIFENVSGLQQGSSIQFAGINVGTVQSIDIIASDKVRVNMNILKDVQQYVKKNSEASINTDGLVGNKVLTLSSGTPESPSIESGDSVHSVKPISMGDIVKNLNESTKEAQNIATDLAEITSKINRGEGTLGKLVNNSDIFDQVDSLMQSFSNSTENINNILAKASNAIDMVTDDIEELSGSIDSITFNIEGITRKMNSSESLVGTLLTDTVFANNIKNVMKNADQTTANLEMGSFSFYQNMEALKHNFLFKGYFEDLGYWDKASFEKTLDLRESRILNKENELDQQEVKLREYRMKLDSLRNTLDEKIDSLKIIK
ncbi:MAG: MlaD family protein [Bacteroidota bacterium]|nr:MlaD family protein [Bacteroidota bacterium]